VDVDLESARRDWSDGERLLQVELLDASRAEVLHRQVDLVKGELLRRIGATFTLAELADEYQDAERWARLALEDDVPAADWPRTLTMVMDAAFYQYARGAADYVP
jgi:hypothetical protein